MGAVKVPTYRCGDNDCGGADLTFQGMFGPRGDEFRRFECPACGTSYPESSLRGDPRRDPSAPDLGLRTATAGTTSLRDVFCNDELIGQIEYVSRRVPAASGSKSSTGFNTHWGWRPVGSRVRNLGNTHEAARRVYDRSVA